MKYNNINGIKSEELLNKIVENNIYDINKENLDSILKRKYKYSNKSVKKSPIKLIFDINDEYILSDKNKIINIYCENGSNLYTDDQETIKKVLSDPLISNISKECFIYSEETKIDDISYITDLDLLNKIVVNGSLVCSWNNIYYYYLMPESSKEILSNYILSDTDNVLSNKNIDDIIRQDLSFLKYVLTINNISNDLFDILFDMYTDKYDLLEASTTRVLIVDEHKLDKLLSIQDYNHKEDVQKYKISIINNNFNIINETNVSDKLNKIGHDYSWMLINNKKPEFSNNTEIKNLIANLNTILKYNIEYYESNERIFIKGSRNKKKGYCSNRQLSSVR